MYNVRGQNIYASKPHFCLEMDQLQKQENIMFQREKRVVKNELISLPISSERERERRRKRGISELGGGKW